MHVSDAGTGENKNTTMSTMSMSLITWLSNTFPQDDEVLQYSLLSRSHFLACRPGLYKFSRVVVMENERIIMLLLK
jgi:hypothetical protein